MSGSWFLYFFILPGLLCSFISASENGWSTTTVSTEKPFYPDDPCYFANKSMCVQYIRDMEEKFEKMVKKWVENNVFEPSTFVPPPKRAFTWYDCKDYCESWYGPRNTTTTSTIVETLTTSETPSFATSAQISSSVSVSTNPKPSGSTGRTIRVITRPSKPPTRPTATSPMTPANLTAVNPTAVTLASNVSLTATIEPYTKASTSLLTSTTRHRATTRIIRPTKPITVKLESGATTKSGTRKTTRKSMFSFFDETTAMPTATTKNVNSRKQPK